MTMTVELTYHLLPTHLEHLCGICVFTQGNEKKKKHDKSKYSYYNNRGTNGLDSKQHRTPTMTVYIIYCYKTQRGLLSDYRAVIITRLVPVINGC